MKRLYNILLHLAFWILFAILPITTVIFSDEPLALDMLVYLISVYVLHVFNFYVGYFLLLPLLLRKKKLILTIFGSIIFVLLFALIRFVIMKNLFNLIDIELSKGMIKFLQNNLSMLFEFTVQSFVFTAFAFLLRSTYEWFINQKQRSELLNQNQASELALLRYQINPHFLFNTLNNIYSLVYKKDDKAPDAVMKLSEILHYTLYKANSEMVQLDNEILYLKSFIELQTLRVSDPNFVSFTVEGYAGGKTIVPMLLLPFVENAFKHCKKELQGPGIIINILINDDFIEFRCKNYISGNGNTNKDNIGGIGLQNIKRRIELLYAKMHTLEISITDTEFNVYLKLYNK
jgi:two-component system, LytTR family, sensor kinase